MPDKPVVNLNISLFGGLRAQCGGEPILFPPQQTGVLLAHLALHAGRVHTREELACLLWPDQDPESSRPNLRQQIYALRRQLEGIECPEAVILTTRTTVQLNSKMVTTDAARFESLVSAARAAAEPARRRDILLEAVDLYRGELLPGFYQDNFVAERDRFARAFRDALLALALAFADSGEVMDGIEAAARAVEIDPLHEESHRVLMRLFGRAGMNAAAIRQYQELERILDRELGSRPSAITEQTLAELRQSPAARTGHEPPATPPSETPPSPEARTIPAADTDQPQRASLRGRTRAASGGTVVVLLLAAGAWLLSHRPHPGQPIRAQRAGLLQPRARAYQPPAPAPPPNRATAWVARYRPGSGDGDSEATSLSVISGDDLLATGFIRTAKHDVDILTLRYDKRGVMRWEARYNGPGNDVDRGRFAAAGRDGSIYVVGESDNGRGNESTRLSGLDIVLLKYDQNGMPSRSWRNTGFGTGVRRYNGPTNGEDTPGGLLVDAQGFVYVLGTSWGGGPGGLKPGRDVVLLKYAPNGDLVWQYRYDGGHGDDTAAGFARDRDGDFYIAATSRTEPESGPETDIVILRVSDAGKIVWARRWGGENLADDTARGIGLDGGGNVHVVGEGRGLPSTPGANSMGFIQLKYDPRGVLLWRRGATSDQDRLATVTHFLVGSDGICVVSGYARLPDGSTFVRTLEQDEQGMVQWSSTTWPCGPLDGPAGLAWRPGGHLFVSGTARWPRSDQDMFVEEYDPTGKPLPARAFDGGRGVDFSRAMVVLDGSPVVAGQSQSGRTRNLTLVRFR